MNTVTVVSIWGGSFFGLMYLLSGWSKVFQRREFRAQLAAMGIEHHGLSYGIALGLPVVELSLGLGLMAMPMSKGLLLASGALLGFFTGFIFHLLRTKRQVSCFCFGGDDGAISSVTLARNGWLLFANVAMFCLPSELMPVRYALYCVIVSQSAASLILMLCITRLTALNKELQQGG